MVALIKQSPGSKQVSWRQKQPASVFLHFINTEQLNLHNKHSYQQFIDSRMCNYHFQLWSVVLSYCFLWNNQVEISKECGTNLYRICVISSFHWVSAHKHRSCTIIVLLSLTCVQALVKHLRIIWNNTMYDDTCILWHVYPTLLVPLCNHNLQHLHWQFFVIMF